MRLSFWIKDHPIIPTGQSLFDFLHVWHTDGGSSPQFTMLAQLYVPYHTPPQSYVLLTSLHGQGGLEMAHSAHAVWRGMEGASTNVHTVFPSRKRWLVQGYPNGVCPQDVTPIAEGPRKLFVYHTTVGPSASYRLRPWKNNIASAVDGIAISLAYGLDIKETDDPHVKLAETALGSISDVTGSGLYLVDILPTLRHVPTWVPGAAFQKRAKLLRKIQEDFRHLPYNETIKNIVRLLCQRILRMTELTGDRPLEVLSPRSR